jgi:hypothetical protein
MANVLQSVSLHELYTLEQEIMNDLYKASSIAEIASLSAQQDAVNAEIARREEG